MLTKHKHTEKTQQALKNQPPNISQTPTHQTYTSLKPISQDKNELYSSAYTLDIIHHYNSTNTVSTYPKTIHAHNATIIKET